MAQNFCYQRDYASHLRPTTIIRCRRPVNAFMSDTGERNFTYSFNSPLPPPQVARCSRNGVLCTDVTMLRLIFERLSTNMGYRTGAFSWLPRSWALYEDFTLSYDKTSARLKKIEGSRKFSGFKLRRSECRTNHNVDEGCGWCNGRYEHSS